MPIWKTDEFGELNAITIKPNSSLGVQLNRGGLSSGMQPPVTHKATAVGNAGIKRSESGTASKNGGKLGLKKAASANPVAGIFNIYDDMNDQVECKLDLQNDAAVVGTNVMDSKPVSQLTERIEAYAIDDEARDMPSVPSTTGPEAPS